MTKKYIDVRKTAKLCLREAKNLLIVVFNFTVVFTFAGFLSKYGFFFDLAANFRLQYLIIQLPFLFVFLSLKQWKLFAIALLVLSINLVQIVPLYINPSYSSSQKIENVSKIKIVCINLNIGNRQYKKVIEYIENIKPDIILLSELNEIWFNNLADVLKQFPYNKYRVQEDCFGIGLFSKIKTDSTSIKYYGEAKVPTIVADVNVENKIFTLIVTHTLPPVNAQQYYWRNNQLEQIASGRNTFSKNLVLIGDLNTTSWTYIFNYLLKKMQLRDSRKGFGLELTWKGVVFSFFPVRLTIDHCLVSENIIVIDHKIGPLIGSDHRPVYVNLGLVN